MAIRLSNKKDVNFKINLLLIFLILSGLILIVFGMLNVNYTNVNSGFSDFNLFIIFLMISSFIIYCIYRQKIMEYDSTSEVLSIKYVTPEMLKYLKSSSNDVFELPKKKIVDVNIESDFFGKYIIVTFINSNNKILKRYFEISSCSKKFLEGLGNDATLIKNKGIIYGGIS